MAELNCQIVRPDRLLFEGPVGHVILVTRTGELGVWPGHASEICALGEGIVRLAELHEGIEGDELRFVVSGGYAEITPTHVIVLADHARRSDDIEPDVVRDTRERAFDEMAKYPEGDHRRAYYEEKIKWCNLLLKQVTKAAEA